MLQAFQAELPEDGVLQGCHCLGQCGNGPMVLILPDEIWYSHVKADHVPQIITQHLAQGKPVKARLYRELHPDLEVKRSPKLVQIMVGASALAIVILLALGVYWSLSNLQ